MIKKKAFVFFLLLYIFTSQLIFSQYLGPITPPESGYGAEGSYQVEVTTIINDHWSEESIKVFHPSGMSQPVPTIFYSHGFGSNDTIYQIKTLRHIASKGYAVVFVPYKTTGSTVPERYATLSDGFVKAGQSLKTIIDTTRIGFFGHSFGGGATPWLAYKIFKQQQWGSNGRFIYCSAPWYTYSLIPSFLDDYPVDCKMISILYDNDETNDHRMGMDIFRNIAIEDSIKDCIMVYTDTISEYVYSADHYLTSQNTIYSEYDAYDHYITFRLLDALSDYCFNHNIAGKDVALGNGSAAQTQTGIFKPLVVTDNPVAIYPKSTYLFPCDTIANERQEYCQDNSEIAQKNPEKLFQIFPNPASGKIHIKFNHQEKEFRVLIYNCTGKLVLSSKNQTEIDVSGYETGFYFISVETSGWIQKTKVQIIDH